VNHCLETYKTASHEILYNWKAFSGVLKGNGCLRGCVWLKHFEICAVLGYYAA